MPLPCLCAFLQAEGEGGGEVDGIRCAVCITAVDEIQMELATTENSTNTLDLRWCASVSSSSGAVCVGHTDMSGGLRQGTHRRGHGGQ
eukprot:1213006-Rhodomonas_salina.1